MKLPNKTIVALADGGRQLLLVNQGDEQIIDLRHVDHDELDNPPAREQGRSKPGQFQASGHAGGGPEGPDKHERAERRFAEAMVEKLASLAAGGTLKNLVIVADPKTLGELRSCYTDPVKAALKHEIPKDLTKLPIKDIEQAITAWTAD